MSATKKGNYIRKRALALTLALLLVFCLFPAFPGAGAAGSLEISSADELKDFLRSCAMDTYSKGLSVHLTADIDLRGDSITPAPIFYGSFDGGDFTISGFSIDAKGSQVGLFRTIQTGATIKALKLSGAAEPKGSASSTGLLCGENHGTISGCSVSGTVAGKTDVGGIAGINASDGVITGCTSSVVLTGTLRTGGIAGSNSGIIEASKNTGSVNVNSDGEDSAPVLSGSEDLSGTSEAPANDAESTAVTEGSSAGAVKDTSGSGSVSDTGGIAGLNEGAIRGCTNRAKIGWQHTGCNVGGIAGTHSGIISACENYGEILGHKDVGGIVGQFEPDMAINFAESSGAELESQLSALTTTLRSLTDVLSSASAESMDRAGEINSAVSVIEDTLKDRTGASGAESSPTIDSLYGSLQIISAAAEKISTSLADFSAAANAELPTMTSELETISVALQEADVSNEAAAILTQADSITAQTGSISATLSGLEELINGISGVLGDTSVTDDAEKRETIAGLFKSYNEAPDRASISDALSAISGSLDTITKNLKTINSKLSKSSAVIVQSMQIISSATGRLQTAAAKLTGSAGTQAAIISANTDKLENTIYGYSKGTAERMEKAFETVYLQLNIVSDCLNSVITTADATNVDIYTLLSSSIDQIDGIGESVSSMLEPPQYSTVDVSENIEQDEKPGQIASCRNNGAVAADINVGGIAGLMALAVGTDPEEDAVAQSSRWVDTAALFRAIVMTSSNVAAVTARSDCAGGAVGRCDIGAVYKTENVSSVESFTGSYCGGIAGRSSGTIISCDSLTDLTGEDYVGGIAGLGANLSGNRAMVRIFSEGECLGAVAGSAGGDIIDNFFVDEGLQGIDGISYAGLAEPLPYADFTALEFINPIFSDLKASFFIDGKLVKQLPLTYGGSIKSVEIPAIPSREDGFGRWESFERESTLRSMTINAAFSPWITTISSSGAQPLMLAEGEFSDSGVVEIEDTTPKIELGGSKKLLASYTYSVSDPAAPAAEEYRLHLRCEEAGDLSVSLVSGSEKTVLSAKRSGSYLVFTAPAEGKLEVRESQSKKIILATFIILAVLILLGFYIYMQKHFPHEEKTPKPRPESKEKPAKKLSKEKQHKEKRPKRKKPRKAEKAESQPQGLWLESESSPEPEETPAPAKPKAEKSRKEKAKKPPKEKAKAPSTGKKRQAPKPKPSAGKPKAPEKRAAPPAAVSPTYTPDGSRLNITIGDDGIDRKI